MSPLFTAVLFFAQVAISPPAAGDRPSRVEVDRGAFPNRVHVIEDYETEIERRWWLRGVEETENTPASLSRDVPNTRACRAAESKDFDNLMGDAAATYKAVIFNPVPGPPMSANTRLAFRYWLRGSDTLRVQIYSLTNNYHRQLVIRDLPQEEWRAATIDMTQARRPDGSGGPLSTDERIDDVQFYIPRDAELLIDDILLFDAASEGEQRPFPRRPIFTAWFDTGEQGREWPGDFDIVSHVKPLTWDAARSVENRRTKAPWLRIGMRGPRPLGSKTKLRFRYHATEARPTDLVLANTTTGETWTTRLETVKPAIWTEATVTWQTPANAFADEIRFLPAPDTVLSVDDLLLYEP